MPTQALVDAVSEVTALRERAEDLIDAADVRITEAANRYVDLESIWYVDQQTGDDQADGNVTAAPLASLQEAVNRTPLYRRADIRVRGDYQTGARLSSLGRIVSIDGRDGNWDITTINMDVGYGFVGNDVVTHGFSLEYGTGYDFNRVNLRMVSEATILGVNANAVFDPRLAALFTIQSEGRYLPGPVRLRNLAIDITNDPYGSLFSDETQRIEVRNITETNPLAGHWVSGVASGANVADTPNVIANFATL